MRLWEAEQPGGGARRLGLARDADLPARGAARPTSRGASSRPRSSSSSTCCPALVESFGFRSAKAPRLRGRRLPRRRRARVAGAGARRHLRPRRVPARLATASRSCSRSRACRELARIGPAEVRERYGVEPGAGAGLHRAARRPVGQDPGRARRRPEEGGRRAQAARLARRRRSPTAASRRSPTSCGSTGASRRWTPTAPLPKLAADAARLGARRRARRGARAERPAARVAR